MLAIAPRVFVGSSSESMIIAQVLQSLLGGFCRPEIWTQGTFQLGRVYIEDLCKKTQEVRYAVFIFAPDDILVTRGKQYAAARDNVIFELGLFMGSLGRQRAWIVHPRHKKLKIPSDLFGVNTAPYDPPDSQTIPAFKAALGPVALEIRQAIESDMSSADVKAEQKCADHLERIVRHYPCAIDHDDLRAFLRDGYITGRQFNDLSDLLNSEIVKDKKHPKTCS